jgi:2-C-methyl-D-erythritol 4-phosphate cytidylyltransferase
LQTPKQFSVVIPAAGIGARMGADHPKQYLLIGTKSIIERTLEVFTSHPQIAEIIVCLHPNDTDFARLDIASHKKVTAIEGGEDRASSVLNGLTHLLDQHADKTVLVHDAARPGLSHTALNRLLSVSVTKGNGAILALPVIDTIKQCSPTEPSKVKQTLDRSTLWQAQTPQMFNVSDLHKALKQASELGQTVTDEASAIELVGGNVTLILGEPCNLKVTQPEDLDLMHYYLSQRGCL